MCSAKRWVRLTSLGCPPLSRKSFEYWIDFSSQRNLPPFTLMPMRRSFFLLFFLMGSLLALPLHSGAAVSLGIAQSSLTDPRPVLGLHGAVDLGHVEFTTYSLGTQSPAYALQAYQFAGMRFWESNEFLWGSLRGGLGWGLHFSKRSLRSGEETLQGADWNQGPCFRVSWRFFGPAFFAVESIFGLSPHWENHVLLNFKTITHGSLGVRF
jgi:hypothetical protein